MSEEATVTEIPTKSARERIFSRPRSEGRRLEVPEWGMAVELRSMTIAQKAQLIGDEEEMTPGAVLRFLPEVVISTCYDPDSGELIFAAEDLERLQAESASVIERVATEGLAVSGLGDEADAEGKDGS